MPFIHVRAYSGRDMETKQKAAKAIVKAASEALDRPETAFTLIFEDVNPEIWDETVAKPVIEPLSDKIIIRQGELV